ncbi:MAG: prolipoprotein diacylglyceryl transferase [Clostridiales bacterium]|nr:prolipoprotein diacylglyceryl transferase [Clostridiales bacterium]MBQ3020325.1 prolipoprotein diacylglyceryl transferase [Clostridia bacterium]
MYDKEILGFFHLYGLMIGVGLLAAFAVLFYTAKKKKFDEKFIDFVFYNGIVSIAVGFGAAALFQAFYNYIENPAAGFKVGEGITFIGGLIGGIVCFLAVYFIFRKRYKTRLIDVVSALPACIIIGHAFGRVGCLFAGCCHGEPTNAWYGITMNTIEYGRAKVVPVQLFEAIFLFALFAICFILTMKKDFKHNLSIYLTGYGLFRFIIEFMRDDPRGEFLGLPPSQFWAIVMIFAGVGVYFLTEYLMKKRKAELEAAENLESVETKKTEEEK